ncbi:MAG: ligase-associated DNA damage response DEXH box helicase [Alphaproteobacteria bacterium]|nr:ligase-associated DNA damage response DEXH box helicase [Alphaproteobacteria bacterium]
MDESQTTGQGTDLPQIFQDWFAERGWQPRAHQLDLLARAHSGQSTLLIAPTGAGKTLAGFLPSLIDLYREDGLRRKPGMAFFGPHTLYISPLKALAVDIARNLEAPIREMDLPVTVETRTGDTPAHKRQRQKERPPDILLTTPEQIALLLADKNAERFFNQVKTIIFDELHSLVVSKRGDLLSLGLARLFRHAPEITTIGLSATVANPQDLQAWLVPQNREHGEVSEAGLIEITGGAKPDISILETEERLPWAGHTALYAIDNIYRQIKEHKTTLLFVNTRFQAELLFQELWRVNEDGLPIAMHHGSLDVGQRRKVEAAMGTGSLRAIVATSTLDLGIDWGDVELVIHVGAPKGASRLAQRIGRSNHRMDVPSKGILVPANRFEVLECKAALDANYIGAQDTPRLHDGALDVLCQHVLGMACAAPFQADDLFAEIKTAAPYADLPRATFDKVMEFVATGGYALKSYERYAKIRKTEDGTWRLTHPRLAQQYRINVGTIIENPTLLVRMTSRKNGRVGRGGRVLGKVEEYFLETLEPGDTFLFAGQIVRFEGIRETEALVTKSAADTPKIPSFAGGKFPLSTYLAQGVRNILSDPKTWNSLPDQVAEWLEIQKARSVLPGKRELLLETFPRADKHYLIAYPFEGRLAHQTLGMLLTRRLERMKARPLGFVATDYALGVWCLRDLSSMIRRGELSLDALFDEDMLGDDLEAWLRESFMMKRTFRNAALISGLIEKRHPGKEKSGRQVTVSSDLIYDVLNEHEPDHILLQAAWVDASTGLLDIERLGAMLKRVKNHLRHMSLDRISPLAVPVMLQIGKEPVFGSADEMILAEVAGNVSPLDDLIEEAMRL